MQDSNTDVKNDSQLQSGWEVLDLDNLPSPNQKLEIEIEGQEPEATIEIEKEPVDTTVPEVKQVAPEPKEAPEAKPEDVGEGSRANKRIRELVARDHEKSREIENLRQQLYEAQKVNFETKTSEVTSRKAQATAEMDLLKKDFIQAELEGDVAKKAEITAKMAKTQVEIMALDTYKEPSAQPQHQSRKPVNGNLRDEVISKLPDIGKDWAKKNSWFVTNPKLTQDAMSLAAEIEAEGYTHEEPEYYTRLEEKMAELYPARFKKQPESKPMVDIKQETQTSNKTEEKPKPVSPVSSSRPVPTQKQGTIRLTKDEVSQAKKWGIPLQEYARQKKLLEQADKEGSKMSQIFEV